MIFTSFALNNWRQFRRVRIEFHPQLTVLTGANGAGKTTILNLLSRHFGWQGSLVSTPRRLGGVLSFHADSWTDDDLKAYEAWLADRMSFHIDPPAPSSQHRNEIDIGDISYSDNYTTPITVPESVSASFQVNLPAQRQVDGLHIPSHRQTYAYQPVENIPTVPRKRDLVFAQYIDIVRSRYYGGHHQRTPNYYMKETLISLAAFGPGNAIIEANEESMATFDGFQDVLSIILPPSLGFLRLSVRLPEVVLVTRSGDFSLDAVSGGIAALIDLAWQIFMFATESTPFVVTIDEPENHLHPELQRSVLPNFLKAFPHVQFICATHNPFIVTSVPESHTYALRYGSDHRVFSEQLSATDRAGTSNEILRDVLGLPSSSPLWVERNLDLLSTELAEQELTPELITRLQTRLSDLGLEKFLPPILAKLAKEQLGR